MSIPRPIVCGSSRRHAIPLPRRHLKFWENWWMKVMRVAARSMSAAALNWMSWQRYRGKEHFNYSVLLGCLSDWYGILGRALTWICSFLINRFQSIKIRKMFFKGSTFVLRCSPGLCSWTTTVYSVYNTIKLSSSQPQIRPSFIWRWHPSTHIFIYSRHSYFPKQLGDCLSHISGWMTNNKCN